MKHYQKQVTIDPKSKEWEEWAGDTFKTKFATFLSTTQANAKL